MFQLRREALTLRLWRALQQGLSEWWSYVIQLTPPHKQLLKRLKPVRTTARRWTPEAVEALRDFFDITDRDTMRRGCTNGDEYAESVTSCINFCEETCIPVECGQVCQWKTLVYQRVLFTEVRRRQPLKVGIKTVVGLISTPSSPTPPTLSMACLCGFPHSIDSDLSRTGLNGTRTVFFCCCFSPGTPNTPYIFRPVFRKKMLLWPPGPATFKFTRLLIN